MAQPTAPRRSGKSSKSVEVDCFAKNKAADLLRGHMLDRLDDGFVRGELGELMDQIEPVIKELGLDRCDFLRAVQNTLFPEAFFPPDEPLDFSGIVPRGGGTAANAPRILSLLTAMRSNGRVKRT